MFDTVLWNLHELHHSWRCSWLTGENVWVCMFKTKRFLTLHYCVTTQLKVLLHLGLWRSFLHDISLESFLPRHTHTRLTFVLGTKNSIHVLSFARCRHHHCIMTSHSLLRCLPSNSTREWDWEIDLIVKYFPSALVHTVLIFDASCNSLSFSPFIPLSHSVSLFFRFINRSVKLTFFNVF